MYLDLELVYGCSYYVIHSMWFALLPFLPDLMVLGGLELCVSRYLSHSQSGLRWRAAELLASCAQNMPQLQIHLLSIGTLPKLLQLTDADPHPTVRVKALYAVSCECLNRLIDATNSQQQKVHSSHARQTC